MFEVVLLKCVQTTSTESLFSVFVFEANFTYLGYCSPCLLAVVLYIHQHEIELIWNGWITYMNRFHFCTLWLLWNPDLVHICNQNASGVGFSRDPQLSTHLKKEKSWMLLFFLACTVLYLPHSSNWIVNNINQSHNLTPTLSNMKLKIISKQK